MFQSKIGKKTSTASHQKADIYATNINIENDKTSFDLVVNNITYKTNTNLLGEHNIQNIILCTCLALSLGINANNILSVIENLKPIIHRLSLIKTHIKILDDSYNCSPSSAKEALNVLKRFSGKKMVVTPGIIECGKEKYNINFSLGEQISFCDYCIIVGEENKKAITNGVKSKNTKTQLLFTNTLEDAKKYFKKLNKDDTLLLLNDLPDDYK